MDHNKGRLGILVGGGPAPGINGVIGAATIKAIENNLEVVGIYDGFKWLAQGDTSQTKPLGIADVSRIHFEGGSILRTGRDNPAKNPAALNKVVETLAKLELDYLVSIGGDDTAFSAHQVAERTTDRLRVAHVPKTIDNDLPLPNNMPTFGYQTARHVGVELVHNLMEDARTTSRWYLVVTMGRKAGHLTLGIGKAAGATLSLIGEEFPQKTLCLDQVCDILEGAILKRRVMGHPDGVALVAEGIGEKLDPQELQHLPGVELEKDPHGHLRLREIPLAHVLKQRLQERFSARGEKITVVDINLGYVMRCPAPIPFDCEYARELGWGAVKYLLGSSYSGGAMVCLDEGHIRPVPFAAMMDPATGRTQVRLVNINSESFEVGLEYMIRLKRSDIEHPDQLARLAQEAQMTPAAFKDKFASALPPDTPAIPPRKEAGL